MSGPISDIYVPSEGDPNARIWIVGEAPGYFEEQKLRPFIGESGEKLEATLSRKGINRSQVFLTNLCHYRPAGNRFELVLGSSRLQEGLAEIHSLLQIHKPNVIAALGNYPLQYLTNRNGITKYRGSILKYDGSFLGPISHEQKIIPTFHPAYILRNRGLHPVFDVDIGRIVSDSSFPELNLPEYNFVIDPIELDYWADFLCSQEVVTSDIENVKGRPDKILCIGFAWSETDALILPYDETNTAKRDFLHRVLSGPVRKVFHYGTHDSTCLRLNGYEVENYTDDTIIQAHVLEPELPRDLAFLASVETRQPYYKGEGRANIPGDAKEWSEKYDKQLLYRYNGTDCCVTYKIFCNQKKVIEDDKREAYYRYRMELQHACLEIGDAGLLVDPERRSLIGDTIKKERAIFTLLWYRLSNSKVNVGSNKQMTELLYGQWKLPERKKYDKKRDKQVLTCDETALVSLMTYCKGKIEEVKRDSTKLEWTYKYEALSLVLKIREYDKLISSYIDVPLFDDGRARSCYKAAGTETGRLSNVKYVDESGFNVQTAPRFSLKLEDKNEGATQPA